MGETELDVFGMSDKLARKAAHKRESEEFFLGEGVGFVVFDISPPTPTKNEVLTITLMLGAFLTVVTLLITVASDPVRNKLGLHERKLEELLTAIEGRIVLARHHESKRAS